MDLDEVVVLYGGVSLFNIERDVRISGRVNIFNQNFRLVPVASVVEDHEGLDRCGQTGKGTLNLRTFAQTGDYLRFLQVINTFSKAGLLKIWLSLDEISEFDLIGALRLQIARQNAIQRPESLGQRNNLVGLILHL